MIMLPPCKTPRAILLCAVKDAAGVLRFPEGGPGGQPGLALDVEPLAPINEQLLRGASAALGKDVALRLAVSQEFADEMTSADVVAATLYVGTLDPAAGIVAEKTWATMPDILRRLQGRARIPYMRAWQVLTGGLQLNTKAVDAAEVAKYFDD